MHTLKEKVLFIFNRFYGNFIKDMKSSNSELRDVIKKNYKTLDKLSETYLTEYWTQVSSLKTKVIDGDFTDFDEIILLKELSYKNISEKLEDLNVLTNYIYTFTVICLVYDCVLHNEDIDDVQKEALYSNVAGYLLKSDINLDNIFDDDIRNLLEKIRSKPEESKAADETDFMGLGNSKIGQLAKEISESIDISNIKVDSPEDIMKLMDFSNSNNLLGDIIKKASSKVQEQMASGKLKQEDLLSEAMSMMSMLGKNNGGAGGAGGNPMSGIFDMMSAFSGNPMMRKASVKDRLKRKVDSRKK